MKTTLCGIPALITDSEFNLQIDDPTEADLRKLRESLTTTYASYERWFCFHSEDIPLTALVNLGAVLDDQSTQLCVYPGTFTDAAHAVPVEQITAATMPDFAAAHDARVTDMYWTGPRLAADLPRWGIFCVRQGGRITDYTIMSMRHPQQAEIFCIEPLGSPHTPALMAHATRYALENGKTEVLFNAYDTMGQQAAESLGFVVTGIYKGYVIRPGQKN